MNRLAAILALTAFTAQPLLAGHCYTQPVPSYAVPYKAQSYAAPVYKQQYAAPYVAPQKYDQTINLIIKQVGYPLADQGKDFYSHTYSLQDQLVPDNLEADYENDRLLIETLSSRTESKERIALKHSEERSFARESATKVALARAFAEALKYADHSLPEEQPQEPEPDGGVLSLKAGVDGILNESCVRCHHSGAADTDLDLTGGWASLTPAQQESIGDRVTTSDEDLRMPKGGKVLPFAARRALIVGE